MMLRLTNIQKIYHNKHGDVQVFSDLNLTIDTNGITMIVGPSGCGKTTLLDIIAKRDLDYQGTVECTGNISYMPQEIALMENMSVYENLLLVSSEKEKLYRELNQFQSIEEKDKKVKKLSVGQKKRVQFAQIMLTNPEILLCDEPTAALDHENRELIMQELKRISERIPVVMVTHEVAICDAYADRICTLTRGKFLKDEVLHVKSECGKEAVADQQSKKRSILQQTWLQIKSRPWVTMLHIIFAFLLILSIYFSFTLFYSITTSTKEKVRWRTGENILIPQANAGNYAFHNEDKRTPLSDAFCIPNTNCAFYYDMYSKQDVKDIMNEVPAVIGYRAGWNLALYSGSFYVPSINYEQAKRIYQEFLASGEEETRAITSIKEQLARYDDAPEEIKQGEIATDLRNYEAFLEGMPYFPMEDTENYFYTGFMTPTTLYQMKKEYTFSLLYGQQMIQDEDMILAYDTAQYLYKELELSSMEDLIGREITYIMASYIPFQVDDYIVGTAPQSKKVFRIRGITDMLHDQEHQVYVRSGIYDTWVESAFQMKPNYINYQYAYFLSDPSIDTEQISQEINHIHPGRYSTYTSYLTSNLNDQTKPAYQNPYIFLLFAGMLTVSCFLFFFMYEYLSSRRMKKEEAIYRTFSYRPLPITLCLGVAYFLIAALLCAGCMPWIITQINTFANAYAYHDILQFDRAHFLFGVFLSLLFYVLVKGGSYVYRTKKNS